MSDKTVAEQMQEILDSTPLLEGRAIGLYPVSDHTLWKWIQQIEEEKEAKYSEGYIACDATVLREEWS